MIHRDDLRSHRRQVRRRDDRRERHRDDRRERHRDRLGVRSVLGEPGGWALSLGWDAELQERHRRQELFSPCRCFRRRGYSPDADQPDDPFRCFHRTGCCLDADQPDEAQQALTDQLLPQAQTRLRARTRTRARARQQQLVPQPPSSRAQPELQGRTRSRLLRSGPQQEQQSSSRSSWPPSSSREPRQPA